MLDRTAPVSALPHILKTITIEPLRINIVYDAVSSAETQHRIRPLLASDGSIVVVSSPAISDDQRASAPGKYVAFVAGNPCMPDRRSLGADLYAQITALFSSGDLKVCVNRV